MNVRAYVAEFIGTFALVWVGIYAIYHLSGVPGGLVGIALAHGLAIAILISATMHVSGGHLNPAVTIAMLMTKRINLMDALGYIVCQLAAGFVAAIAIKAVPLFDGPTLLDGSLVVFQGTPIFQPLIDGVALEPSSVAYSAWMLEAIATFFLVFAVLGTAVDKRAARMGGLYIGLAITIGILAIGPLTGGALNPARWMGPAMIGDVATNSTIPLKWLFFSYCIGPITGGVLAGFVYQLVMVSKEQLVEESSG